MTQNQKIIGGVLVVVAVIFFAVLYNQFSSNKSANGVQEFVDNSIAGQDVAKSNPSQIQESIPETPDAAVDAIVSDASLSDDSAFQSEINGEQNAIKESGDEINNLTQTYDENQL